MAKSTAKKVSKAEFQKLASDAQQKTGVDINFWLTLLTQYGPAMYSLFLAILEKLRESDFEKRLKAAPAAECDEEVARSWKSSMEAACHSLCEVHCLGHILGCCDHEH